MACDPTISNLWLFTSNCNVTVTRVWQVTALRAEVQHIQTSMALLSPYLSLPLIPSGQQQAVNSNIEHSVQPAVLLNTNKSCLGATDSRQFPFMSSLLHADDRDVSSPKRNLRTSCNEVEELTTKSAEVPVSVGGEPLQICSNGKDMTSMKPMDKVLLPL